MPATAQTQVQKYLEIIAQYDSEFKKWEARAVKILKRYRDDNRSGSSAGNNTAKFNILWSNVQTLKPAVFARMPKADVSRRFSDTDPVGRVASLLIERCLDYETEHFTDFRSAMNNCVEDRFLPGRGTAWVRYDPHVTAQEEPQVTDDVPDPADHTAGDEEPAEQIEYECSPTDYVHWKDMGHSSARTWEEVGQVWRWVYLTKDGLTARFGKKIAKKIPLDSGPEKLQRNVRGEKVENDRAKIAELWDKEANKVVWLSKHMPDVLDERDDPLELENFFPCPKPLYATTTTDSLVPVPDFVLYQDQANELDILADRIDGLVKALRVRGIYDSSQPALQRLLTEGDNNTLIPTDKFQAFAEKGGLKGTIDILPLDVFAAALLQCYQAEANLKATIYEITGLSDIVRGQGKASETATAQQIKGQYVGLRLRSMQDEVAQFASELFRIKAQIICSKYQDKTILAYAAADQLSPDDQKLIPQALQLLRSNPLRNFRIEVEADSLVQIDETQNKQDRLEFLNATSNFLREAIPAGQQVPELAPAIMAMIKFGIAGFKQARTIEGTLDTALENLQKRAAQQAANPQPHPEQIKAQAAQQTAQIAAQADAQAAQVKAQSDMQMEQMRAQTQAQIEQMRVQNEQAIKTAELQQKEQLATMQNQIDIQKAFIQQETAITVARIGAQETDGAEEEAVAAQEEDMKNTKDIGDKLDALIEHLTKSQPDMAQAITTLAQSHAQTAQGVANLHKAISAPKRIVRGPDGRAVGVEPVTTH